MENFNQIESDLLNKIKIISDRNALDSVKTEIERMGGSIKVLSKVEQGTIFEVFLPLIK